MVVLTEPDPNLREARHAAALIYVADDEEQAKKMKK